MLALDHKLNSHLASSALKCQQFLHWHTRPVVLHCPEWWKLARIVSSEFLLLFGSSRRSPSEIILIPLSMKSWEKKLGKPYKMNFSRRSCAQEYNRKWKWTKTYKISVIINFLLIVRVIARAKIYHLWRQIDQGQFENLSSKSTWVISQRITNLVFPFRTFQLNGKQTNTSRNGLNL